MGDEILKNIILMLLLLFSSGVAKENLSKNLKNKIASYDKLFTQISKKRTGIPNAKIEAVKNPFVMIDNKIIVNDSNVTIKEITYTLSAIINNRAKINGEWYELNNEIDNFYLVSIKRNSVVIKNEHSKKELFIRENDASKIKFSSK